MFDSYKSRNKFSKVFWYGLFLLVGLGGLLVSLHPTDLSSLPPTATAKSNQPNQAKSAPASDDQPFLAQEGNPAAPQPDHTDTSTEKFLLPEYDPQAIPGLADEVPEERPFWQVAGEMALKLLLVLALVYAVLTGLRWLQKGRAKFGVGEGAIRILETKTLTAGQSLHLVVVGEKTLLIGASQQQLSLLTELNDFLAPPPADEASEFETALTQAKTSPASLDWQLALENLRHTVQSLRPNGNHQPKD